MAEKIRDYASAEAALGRWIRDKFPKARNVKYQKVAKVDDKWIIEGILTNEVNFFKDTRKSFKVQMDEGGFITHYEIIDAV
jgi:hypothetical protein